MSKGEFLLEVRAEEIPARMLPPAVKELGSRVFEDLMSRGLGPREVETGFTPRRLVLTLRGLPDKEPDREEEVTGPPTRVAYDADGKPTKALEGFAKRLGLPVDELKVIETSKGEYVGGLQRTEGKPTRDVLAEIVPQILRGLAWAKTMVWGEGHGPWARPVHGIVALLDGEVVPFELFGIASGAETVGHRILSPELFPVSGADDYRERMAERGIVVDAGERARILAEGMEAAAEAAGGRLVADPPLLSKLAAICEIPGVMEGTFDERYLALPREVLITSLRDHQSAFTVEKGDELLARYLTVMDRADDPAGRVRAGNEWVVAARLADGEFFHGEDRKRGLAERAQDLTHLTFHVELGSYADKSERLADLARQLCSELGWGEIAEEAQQAARLLKVDLVTEMVKEFTSLQGIMGGLYARDEGLPEGVWQGIYDQYLPASSEDPIPRGRVGQVVGLADRIDTLVGIFGLGLVPTGSRDPFGLRRAAQGVVRIALEGGLPLDLDLIAAKAALLYGDRLKTGGQEILESLRPFLDDRVRHVLGQRGFAYDTIDAALAAGSSNLPDLEARVQAVHTVREEREILSLVLSAKRIVNILKDAPSEELEDALLIEPAERRLADVLGTVRAEVKGAAGERDYETALRRTAALADPLEGFFAEVLVMDEDENLRRNRIALLQAVHRVVVRTARLTEIVVDKAEHRAKFGD